MGMDQEVRERISSEAASLYQRVSYALLRKIPDATRRYSFAEAETAAVKDDLPLLRLFLKYAHHDYIILSEVREVYEILQTVTDDPESFVTDESIGVFLELCYTVFVIGRKNENVNTQSLFAGILLSGERDIALLRTIIFGAEPVSGEHFNSLLSEIRSGTKSLASGVL